MKYLICLLLCIAASNAWAKRCPDGTVRDIRLIRGYVIAGDSSYNTGLMGCIKICPHKEFYSEIAKVCLQLICAHDERIGKKSGECEPKCAPPKKYKGTTDTGKCI